MPRIVFIVVDLPEALPPSRHTISPLRTSMVTPRSARNGAVAGLHVVEPQQRFGSAHRQSGRGRQFFAGAMAEIGLDHRGMIAHFVEAAFGDLHAVVERHHARTDAASPAACRARSRRSSGRGRGCARCHASAPAFPLGFMPAAGSSSSSSVGSVASARAISSRRRLA